jgi:hypothetical protein
MSAHKLAVVDLGSEDDTIKILEKLRYDYQYMDIYKDWNKDEVFSGLDK